MHSLILPCVWSQVVTPFDDNDKKSTSVYREKLYELIEKSKPLSKVSSKASAGAAITAQQAIAAR